MALLMKSNSAISISIGSHRVIDRINILQTTLGCMRKSILRLPCRPDRVLIDGNKAPVLPGYLLETICEG